ncbi:MAG: hypothetical protein AB1716_25340, partial [Planctomycetota bacterium]
MRHSTPHFRLRAFAAVLALVTCTAWAFPQGEDARAGAQSAATAQSAPAATDDLVAAIQSAADPSAAVEAYAKARAAQPDDPRLAEVYVRRMVALGAPQLAEKQAEEAIARNPRDGVAWAVLAFCSGAANDTTAALNELASAVEHAPEHGFVQHTAGQLLGWYDVLGKASELPPGLPEALEKIKRDFGARRPFTEAYAAARQFYQQAQAAEAKNVQPGPEPESAAGGEPIAQPPPAAAAAAPVEQALPTPVAPPSTEPGERSDVIVQDSTAPVVVDEGYTTTEPVEPTYVEPMYEEPLYAEAEAYPVYVPTYYPAYYEVPTYYSYPSWSFGFGWSDWGYPWWGGGWW